MIFSKLFYNYYKKITPNCKMLKYLYVREGNIPLEK